MSQEDEYKKSLAANGVQLEGSEDDKGDDEEDEKEEPEAPAKVNKEDPSDKKEPLKTEEKKEPEPERKRSIYEDLKDRKKDLKSEREQREAAEKERDELRRQLDAVGEAKTPEERKDAQDEIDAFLASHKELDKAAIKDLLDLARKGAPKGEIDEAIKKDLDDFKAWKASNSKSIEQQMFNDEFERTTPALKQLFPTITDAELKTVKVELDKLSHTKEWHDKDLEYVAFKHKDTLSALVSPKKRGMESKSHKDVEENSDEFDSSADLADMTPAQREAWEKSYREASKPGAGLIKDGKKKIII